MPTLSPQIILLFLIDLFFLSSTSSFMCPFSHPFLSLSIFHLPFSHLDPNSPLLVNDISPRRAGEDHRTRQQNKLMAFHLRRGSTPPLIGGNNRYGSVAVQMTILYTIYMLSYSLSLSLLFSFSSPLFHLPQPPPFLCPLLPTPRPPHFICSSIFSSPCLLSFSFLLPIPSFPFIPPLTP